MSIDAYDVVDLLANELSAFGYSLHETGTPEHLQAPGVVEEHGHSFTWSDGVGHSETSEKVSSYNEALSLAATHFFAMARGYLEA
jgi:hypothetical protein